MLSRHWIRELLTKPLKIQKKRLVILLLALLVLGLSESFLILNIRGFVRVLFHDSRTTWVALGELLPESFSARMPVLASYQLPAQDLALYVPMMIMLAGLARSGATYLYQLNQQSLALFLAKNYRDHLFSALVHLPYLELKKRPTGEWMSMIMNDVLLLQARVADLMTALVKDVVLLMAAFVGLAIVHWPSALLLLAAAPFMAMGLGRGGKRIGYYTEAFQRALARMAGAVLHLRAVFDFVRSQGGETRELVRFSRVAESYYTMMRRSLLIRATMSPALEFLGFALFAGFVWAVGAGFWGASWSPALIMQFFVALGLLFRPLKEIGEQLARYHETRGSLAASFSMFQALESLNETRSRGPTIPGDAPPISSLVQIDEVQAGFGERVEFSCQGFAIQPGRAVAIIGPSGAGKSTWIRTLAGLIPPLSWVGSPSPTGMAGLVSLVSQEPFLFRDTVRANLTYGWPHAVPPSDEQIWEALRIVNMDQEIARLREGLETRLHAVSANLSGGQVQRLVVARAILRPSQILLLDEATSAVDPASEEDMTRRLLIMVRQTGQSLLSVTHRLSWLHLFDEVIFVEKGGILFRGSHESLLQEPRYQAFCRSST